MEIDISGPNGNAFYILAQAKVCAKQLGLNYEDIQNDMTSGDYDHLLDVFEKHFGDYVTLTGR